METPAETGHWDTYQWLLRALGAHLDQEPSCRISLVEVPEGFLVRLQRVLHKFEPEIIRFEREMLHQELDHLFQQHKPASRTFHQGVWSAFPNGHADFFRALGYELDQESARNVMLDELEDGMVVTYSRPDGDGWQKRVVVLERGDIESILNAAFERRNTEDAQPQLPA